MNEAEAEIVREIYSLFLTGLTPHTIAKRLTERGIKTPAGKDKWHSSTVKSILTNEKYKGDALLQKTYTSDFLTKKKKINHGEIPMYYVEGSHEGIVTLRYLKRYRLKWRDGSHRKAAIVAWIFLRQNWSAANADAFTVRKSGIRVTAIGV